MPVWSAWADSIRQLILDSEPRTVEELDEVLTIWRSSMATATLEMAVPPDLSLAAAQEAPWAAASSATAVDVAGTPASCPAPPSAVPLRTRIALRHTPGTERPGWGEAIRIYVVTRAPNKSHLGIHKTSWLELTDLLGLPRRAPGGHGIRVKRCNTIAEAIAQWHSQGHEEPPVMYLAEGDGAEPS